MFARARKAAYMGAVLAAAAVLFLAVVVGMNPGLVDVGLPINETTWVLFAVSSGVLAIFVMLVAFRTLT